MTPPSAYDADTSPYEWGVGRLNHSNGKTLVGGLVDQGRGEAAAALWDVALAKGGELAVARDPREPRTPAVPPILAARGRGR